MKGHSKQTIVQNNLVVGSPMVLLFPSVSEADGLCRVSLLTAIVNILLVVHHCASKW